FDLVAARPVHLPRRTFAIIEAPHATVVCRQISRKHDTDAMVVRDEVGLALAVAVANLEQSAGTIDAQPLDRVARPAAAVAFACQALLGSKHAARLRRGNVTLKVGFAAKQAEAVLHLPLDVRSAAAGNLGAPVRRAAERAQRDDQAGDEKATHGVGSAP